MSEKRFFLSKDGAHVGPFSPDEVLQKLEAKEHSWTDYVYSEEDNDWILLMSHPQFASAFNAGRARPQASPIPAAAPVDIRPNGDLREKAWYVLRDGNNHGPYSKLDLIQMLQEKTLFEYDFVWHHGMVAWKRLAEVEEFSAESIRTMKESNDKDLSEIFFRRRHARASYGCTLLVHNSKSVFKGRSIEISEGGAGVIIENPVLQPGQTVYLHFQPGEGVPPFNAVCSIVSKRVASENETDTAVRYGVQFKSISQSVRQAIRDYTEKNSKAA